MSEAGATEYDVNEWLKENKELIMEFTPQDIESMIKTDFGTITEDGLQAIEENASRMAVEPSIDGRRFVPDYYDSKLFKPRPAKKRKQPTLTVPKDNDAEAVVNEEPEANEEEQWRKIFNTTVIDEVKVSLAEIPEGTFGEKWGRKKYNHETNMWDFFLPIGRPRGWGDGSEEDQDKIVEFINDSILEDDPDFYVAFPKFQFNTVMAKDPDLARVPSIIKIEELADKYAEKRLAEVMATSNPRAEERDSIRHHFKVEFMEVQLGLKYAATKKGRKAKQINKNTISESVAAFRNDPEMFELFVREYTIKPYGMHGIASWTIVPDIFRKTLLQDPGHEKASDSDLMRARIGGSEGVVQGADPNNPETYDASVLHTMEYMKLLRLLMDATDKGWLDKAGIALKKLDESMAKGRAVDTVRLVPPQYKNKVVGLLTKHQEALKERDRKAAKLLALYSLSTAFMQPQEMEKIRTAEADVMLGTSKMLAIQEAVKQYTNQDFTLDTHSWKTLEDMTGVAREKIENDHTRSVALLNLERILNNPQGRSFVGRVTPADIKERLDEFKKTNRLRLEDLPSAIQQQINNPTILTQRETGREYSKAKAIADINKDVILLNKAYDKFGPTMAGSRLNNGIRAENILSRTTNFSMLMDELNVGEYAAREFEIDEGAPTEKLLLLGGEDLGREEVLKRSPMSNPKKWGYVFPTDPDAPAVATPEADPFLSMMQKGLADERGFRPEDHGFGPEISRIIKGTKQGIDYQGKPIVFEPAPTKKESGVFKGLRGYPDPPPPHEEIDEDEKFKPNLKLPLDQQIVTMMKELTGLVEHHDANYKTLSLKERATSGNRIDYLKKEIDSKLAAWREEGEKVDDPKIRERLERRIAKNLQFIAGSRVHSIEKEIGRTPDKYAYEKLVKSNPRKAVYYPAIRVLTETKLEQAARELEEGVIDQAQFDAVQEQKDRNDPAYPWFQDLIGEKSYHKQKGYEYRLQAKMLGDAWSEFFNEVQMKNGKEFFTEEYVKKTSPILYDEYMNFYSRHYKEWREGKKKPPEWPSGWRDFSPDLQAEMDEISDTVAVDIQALLWLAEQAEGKLPLPEESELAFTGPVLTPMLFLAGGGGRGSFKTALKYSTFGMMTGVGWQAATGGDLESIGKGAAFGALGGLLIGAPGPLSVGRFASFKGPSIVGKALSGPLPGTRFSPLLWAGKKAEGFQKWGMYRHAAGIAGKKRSLIWPPSPVRWATIPARRAIDVTRGAYGAATSKPGSLLLGAYFLNDPRDMGPMRGGTEWYEGLEFQARELLKDVHQWGRRGAGATWELLPEEIKDTLLIGDMIDAKASGMSVKQLHDAVEMWQNTTKTRLYTPTGALNIDPTDIGDDINLAIAANHELSIRMGSMMEEQEMAFVSHGALEYLAKMETDNWEHVFGKDSPLNDILMGEYPTVLLEKVKKTIRYLPTIADKFRTPVPEDEWKKLPYTKLFEYYELGLSPDDIQVHAIMMYNATTAGGGKTLHALDNFMFEPIFDADTNQITRRTTGFGYIMAAGAAFAPRIIMEGVKQPYYWYEGMDMGDPILRSIAKIGSGDGGMMQDVDGYMGSLGYGPTHRFRNWMKYPTTLMDWLNPWEKTLYGPVGRLARRGTTYLTAASTVTGRNWKTYAALNTGKAIKWGTILGVTGIYGTGLADLSLKTGIIGGIGVGALSPIGRALEVHRLRKVRKQLTDKKVLDDESVAKIAQLDEDIDRLTHKVRQMDPEFAQRLGPKGVRKIARRTASYDTDTIHWPGVLIGAPLWGIAKIVNSVIFNKKIAKHFPKIKKGTEYSEHFFGGLMSGEWHQFFDEMRSEDFRNRIRGHDLSPSDHRRSVTAADIFEYEMVKESERFYYDKLDVNAEVAANRLGLKGQERQNYIRDQRDMDRRLTAMFASIGIDYESQIKPAVRQAQADLVHRVAYEVHQIMHGEGAVNPAIKRHSRWKALEQSLQHLVENDKLTSIAKDMRMATWLAMADMLFPGEPVRFFDLLDFKFEQLGEAAKPEKIYKETFMGAWGKLMDDLQVEGREEKATNLSQAIGDALAKDGPAKKDYYNSGTFTELKNTDKEIDSIPVDKHLINHMPDLVAEDISPVVAKGILAWSHVLTVSGKADDVHRNKPVAHKRAYPEISKKIWPKDEDLPSERHLAAERESVADMKKEYAELNWAGAERTAKEKLADIESKLEKATEKVERFKEEGPKEASKKLTYWTDAVEDVKGKKPRRFLVKGSERKAKQIATAQKLLNNKSRNERIKAVRTELQESYIWSDILEQLDEQIKTKTAELKELKKEGKSVKTKEAQLAALKGYRKSARKGRDGHKLTKKEAKGLASSNIMEFHSKNTVPWKYFKTLLKEMFKGSKEITEDNWIRSEKGRAFYTEQQDKILSSPGKLIELGIELYKDRGIVAINNDLLALTGASTKEGKAKTTALIAKIEKEYDALPWDEQLKGIPEEELAEIKALPTAQEKVARYKKFFVRENERTAAQKKQAAEEWIALAKEEQLGVKTLETDMVALQEERASLAPKVRELENKVGNDLFNEALELKTRIEDKELEIVIKQKPLDISKRVRDETPLIERRPKEDQESARVYDVTRAKRDPKSDTYPREAITRFSTDEGSAVIDSVSGTWLFGQEDFNYLSQQALVAKDYQQRKLALIQMIQYFARSGKERIYIPLGKQGVFHQLFGEGVRLGYSRRIQLLKDKIEDNEKKIKTLEEYKEQVVATADPAKLQKAESKLLTLQIKDWEELPWDSEIAKAKAKIEALEEKILEKGEAKFKAEEDSKVAADDASKSRKEYRKKKGKTKELLKSEKEKFTALEKKEIAMQKKAVRIGKAADKLKKQVADHAAEIRSLEEARDGFEPHTKIRGSKGVLSKIKKAQVKFDELKKGLTDPSVLDKLMRLARETKKIQRELKRVEAEAEVKADSEKIKKLDNALFDALTDYMEDVDPKADNSVRRIKTALKTADLREDIRKWITPKALPDQEYIVIRVSPEYQKNLVYTEGHTLATQRQRSRSHPVKRVAAPEAPILKVKGNSLRVHHAMKEKRAELKKQRVALERKIKFPDSKKIPTPRQIEKLNEQIALIDKELQAYREDIAGHETLSTDFERRTLEFEDGKNAHAYTTIDRQNNAVVIQATPAEPTQPGVPSGKILVIEDVVYENKPIAYRKNTTERGWQLQQNYLDYEVERQKLLAEKGELQKLTGEEKERAKGRIKHHEDRLKKIDDAQSTIRSNLEKEGHYDILSSGDVGTGKKVVKAAERAKLAEAMFQNTIFSDYAGEPRRVIREFIKAVVQDGYTGIAWRIERDTAFGAAVLEELKNIKPLDTRISQIDKEKGAYTFVHFGTFENEIRGHIDNYGANETRTGAARYIFDEEVASVYEAVSQAVKEDGTIDYGAIPPELRSKVKTMENWLGGEGKLTHDSLIITGGRSHPIRTDKNIAGLSESDVSNMLSETKERLAGSRRDRTRQENKLFVSTQAYDTDKKEQVTVRKKADLSEDQTKRIRGKIKEHEISIANYEATEAELNRALALLRTTKPSTKKPWHVAPKSEGRIVEMLVKVDDAFYRQQKEVGEFAFIDEVPHIKLTMMLQEAEPKANIRTNDFATLSGKKTLIINGIGTKAEADSAFFSQENQANVTAVVSKIAREAAARGFDAVAFRIQPRSSEEFVSTHGSTVVEVHRFDRDPNLPIVSAFDEIKAGWGIKVPEKAPQLTVDGVPIEIDWVQVSQKDVSRSLSKSAKAALDGALEGKVGNLSAEGKALIPVLKKEAAKLNLKPVSLILMGKYKALAHDLGIYSIVEDGRVYDAIYTMPITSDMTLSVNSKATRTRIQTGTFVPRGDYDANTVYLFSDEAEPMTPGSVASLILDTEKDTVVVDTPAGIYELKITKRPEEVDASKVIGEIYDENGHPVQREDLSDLAPIKKELFDLFQDEDIVTEALRHLYNEEVLDAYKKRLTDNGFEVSTRAESKLVGDIQSRTTQRVRDLQRVQRRVVGDGVPTRADFAESRIFETGAKIGRIGKGESEDHHTYHTEPAVNRLDTGLNHLDWEALVDGFGLDTMLMELQSRVIDAEAGKLTTAEVQRAHKISLIKENAFDVEVLKKDDPTWDYIVKRAFYTNSPLFKLVKGEVKIDAKVAARLMPDLPGPTLTIPEAEALIKRISESLKTRGRTKLNSADLRVFGALLGLDNITPQELHKYIFQRKRSLSLDEWQKKTGKYKWIDQDGVRIAVSGNTQPFMHHPAYGKTEYIPVLSLEYAAKLKARESYTPLIEMMSSSYDSGSQNMMAGMGLPGYFPSGAATLLNVAELAFAADTLSRFRLDDAKTLSERGLPVSEEVPGYNPQIDVDPRIMAVIDQFNDGIHVRMSPDASFLDWLQANEQIMHSLMPPMAKKIAADYYESEQGILTEKGRRDFTIALQNFMTKLDQPPDGRTMLMMKEMGTFLDKMWLKMRHLQLETGTTMSGRANIKMTPEAMDKWSGVFKPELRAAEHAVATIRADESFQPKFTVRVKPGDPDALTTTVLAAGKEAILRGEYVGEEVLRDFNNMLFDPINPMVEKNAAGEYEITSQVIRDGATVSAVELYRRAWVIDKIRQFKEAPRFANMRSDNYVAITTKTTVSKKRRDEIHAQARTWMDNLLDKSVTGAIKDITVFSSKWAVETWLGTKDEDMPSVESGKPHLISEEKVDYWAAKINELPAIQRLEFPKILSNAEIFKEKRFVGEVDGERKYRLYPAEVAATKKQTRIDPVKIHHVEVHEAKRVLREANKLGGFPMSQSVPATLLMPWDEFVSQRKVGDKYVIYQHELNDLSDAFMDTVAPIGSYRNARLEAAPKSMVEGLFKSMGDVFSELGDLFSPFRRTKGIVKKIFYKVNKYPGMPPALREFLEKYEKNGNAVSDEMFRRLEEFRRSDPDQRYDNFTTLLLSFTSTLTPPVRPELLPVLYTIKGRMEAQGEGSTRANPYTFEELTDEGFLGSVQSILMSDGHLNSDQQAVINRLSELRDKKDAGTYQQDADNIRYHQAVTQLTTYIQEKVNQVNLIGDIIVKSYISRHALEWNPHMPSAEQAQIRRLAFTLFYEGRFGQAVYGQESAFEAFVVNRKKGADWDFRQRTGQNISTNAVVEFLRDKGYGDYRSDQKTLRSVINRFIKEIGAEPLPKLNIELTEEQKFNVLGSLNRLLRERGPEGSNRAHSLLTLHNLLGAKSILSKGKHGLYPTKVEFILADILVALAHHDFKKRSGEELSKLVGAIDLDSLYAEYAIRGANPISSRQAFETKVMDQVHKLMNFQNIPLVEVPMGVEKGTQIRPDTRYYSVSEATGYDAFEPNELQVAQMAAEKIVHELKISPRPVAKTDNFGVYVSATGKRYVLPIEIIDHVQAVEQDMLNLGGEVGKAGPGDMRRIQRGLDKRRMEAERRVALDENSMEDFALLTSGWEKLKAKYWATYGAVKGADIDYTKLAVMLKADKDLDRRWGGLWALRQREAFDLALSVDQKSYMWSQAWVVGAASAGAVIPLALGASAPAAIAWTIFAGVTFMWHHENLKETFAAVGKEKEWQRVKETFEAMEDRTFDRARPHVVKEIDDIINLTYTAYHEMKRTDEAKMEAAQIAGQKAEEALQMSLAVERAKATADLMGLEFTGLTETTLMQIEKRKAYMKAYYETLNMPLALEVVDFILETFFSFGKMVNNIKMMTTVGKFGLPYMNANMIGAIQQTHLNKIGSAMNYGAIAGGTVGFMLGDSMAAMTAGGLLGIPVGQAAVGLGFVGLSAALKSLPYLTDKWGIRAPAGASYMHRPKQVMGAIFLESNFLRHIEKFGFEGNTIEDYLKSVTAFGITGAGLGLAATGLLGAPLGHVPNWIIAGAAAGLLNKVTGMPTAALIGAISGGVGGLFVGNGMPQMAIYGAGAGALFGGALGQYFGDPRKMTTRTPDEKFRFPPIVTPEGKVYFADDISRQVIEYGIGSSYLKAETGAEFLKDMTKYHEGQVRKMWSWFGGERFQQMLIEVAEAQDKYYRYSLYFDLLEAGHRPVDAAKIVRETMFDYGNLTDFERKYLRNIFLFYSYTRRNLAFVTQMITRNPERVLGWMRLRRDLMNEAYGFADNEFAIPDYLKYRIPMSWGMKKMGKKKGMYGVPNLDVYDRVVTLFPSLGLEDSMRFIELGIGMMAGDFFGEEDPENIPGFEDVWEFLGTQLNPLLSTVVVAGVGEQFFGSLDITKIPVPLSWIQWDAAVAGATGFPGEGGHMFVLAGTTDRGPLKKDPKDDDRIKLTVWLMNGENPSENTEKFSQQQLASMALNPRSNPLIGNIVFRPATPEDALKLWMLNNVIGSSILSNKKLGPISFIAGSTTGRYGTLGRKADQVDMFNHLLGKEASQAMINAFGGVDMDTLMKEAVEKFPDSRDDQRRYFSDQFYNTKQTDDPTITVEFGRFMFDLYQRPENLPVEYGLHRMFGYGTVPIGVESFLYRNFMTDKQRLAERKSQFKK